MADEWYYAENGQQRGPVSAAALRDLAAHGRLSPTDLVWTDGMSQWAPASATRGLFRATPLLPSPIAAPGPLPLDSYQEEALDARDNLDLLAAYAPTNLQRGSRGMTSGGKFVLVGGIVLVIGLAVVVGIIAAVVVGKPQAERTYIADLNVQGQTVERLIEFKENERVHITVTTGEWGGVFEPDVDLFVVDPNGNVVAQDVEPDKDCDVRFEANQTGTYRVILVLDTGIWARCTVRY